MKKVFLMISGAVCLFMGMTVILWIGYNFFIEMQPEARGSSGGIISTKLHGIISVIAWLWVIYVGSIWMQGKTLKMKRDEKE